MASEEKQVARGTTSTGSLIENMAGAHDRQWRIRSRNPWACSISTALTTVVGFVALFLMVQSFLTKQMDAKGCEMSYMRPMYSKFDDFDTEHTRFASKYSLYLYREWGVDEEFTVKGVPVLFIPGNAGSYKQVRSLAAEAAYHYQDSVQHSMGRHY
jgi:glycosylphosphatidylinositol deacylase